MDGQSDFGTTEARKHYKFKMEPRGISNGGRVVTVGIKNVIPDLLEAIYDGGYLKGIFENEKLADTRVANGRAFQEMYQFWNSRGKDLAAAEMVYRMMPTLEGHVGSERDIAETVYYEVLRHMKQNGLVVYRVCIAGHLKDSPRAIRVALDGLPRAIESARDLIRQRLK